jgi:hypothetical protein
VGFGQGRAVSRPAETGSSDGEGVEDEDAWRTAMTPIEREDTVFPAHDTVIMTSDPIKAREATHCKKALDDQPKASCPHCPPSRTRKKEKQTYRELLCKLSLMDVSVRTADAADGDCACARARVCVCVRVCVVRCSTGDSQRIGTRVAGNGVKRKKPKRKRNFLKKGKSTCQPTVSFL